MRKPVDYKKRAIYFIVMVVILFFGISIAQLTNAFYKTQELQEQAEGLQDQIEQEQERQLELLEKEDYIHSREFIEDTAREKLNLLYEDEIVFEEKAP